MRSRGRSRSTHRCDGCGQEREITYELRAFGRRYRLCRACEREWKEG